MTRPSRSILDTVDNTINSDAPLLTGLTNGGPVTLGESMPLDYSRPVRNEGGVFGNTPLTNSLNNDDWDEDWQDTDPMSFDDDQIFENSAFLGIRIGKKAKARGAAKKAARQAKRAAKKAAKQAEADAIGQDSIWKQPDTVTPANYDPLGLAATTPAATSNASMLETLNDPNSTFNLRNILSQAGIASGSLGVATGLGLTGFENTNTEDYGFDPDEDGGGQRLPKPAKNNTLLYVGIGVAVVIILIVALKNRK